MIRLLRFARKRWLPIAVVLAVVWLLNHPAATGMALVVVAGVLFVAAMAAVGAYVIRKNPREDVQLNPVRRAPQEDEDQP